MEHELFKFSGVDLYNYMKMLLVLHFSVFSSGHA